MKKKLMAVLLGTVLSMAVLAGCGGGKEASTTPSSQAESTQETVVEEEVTEEVADTAADVSAEGDYASIFPYGFMGVSSDGTTLYWVTTEAVDYGVFVELDPETAEYVALVGAIVGNGDGTLTITDDGTGVALTVTVEEVQDETGESGLLLTTENGVEALLAEGDSTEVINQIMTIEEVATGLALNGGADDVASPMDEVLSVLTLGFAGEGDDGSTLLWATDDAVTVGILMVVAPDNSQYLCFAGEIIDNGDGTLTVTDAESATQVTFGVESDDTYLYLTIDGSAAALESAPVTDVIVAIDDILASAE